MEIFGGFMVMLSILGFIVVVAWIMLPIVVFAMKVKVDRMLCLLEEIDNRLKLMEGKAAGEAPPSQEPADPPIQ
jgi:uncharacterized protein YoxC